LLQARRDYSYDANWVKKSVQSYDAK
jgi:hypothetical protein